ncbi:MAG: 3-oxoacyl-ACP reductase FabG [Bacteroidetes bacterium]|nr:3-oxoacyl-ACP reductase FabG [Bacteroidota bacterium]MBK8657974.1 3-oxoacyl-ACP reductase FabG [Bacteroidota bacterium]
MSNRFNHKTVIITGGAAGIGQAAATRFLLEGANVAVWDVQEPDTKWIDEMTGAFSDSYLFIKVNTADFEAVEAAAITTAQHFKKIDILINNAGITRDASLLKMTTEQWQQVMDVNLTGVFNCCKATAPFLIENKGGRIINTSSVVGLYGNYGQANYAATKAGVIALTKTLARELGKHHITVNAVAPGFIATDMIKTIPEKVIEMMTEKVPLKRLGTPDDVAKAYAFLASTDAQFITGAVLSVDGGLTI